MYAITGATGNIGSRIADILLDRGEQVRVIGRNAARLQRFVDRGAEAAVGDLRENGFAAKAFSGATAVFTVIPPNFAAADFRAYQNEIGASIASGIDKAGVRHVVNLSSQGAELTAGTGPILGLRDQELRLNRFERVNVLHLRPAYFMENLLANIPLINSSGIAGSALRGNRSFAMIATKDIADCAAERLVALDFAGKRVQDLLGQRDLTLEEAIVVIGRAIGKPELRYVQFTYDDASRWLKEAGLSADLARLLIEMSKSINEGRYGVGRNPQNTTPTAIEEFAETFARLFAASTMPQAA